MNCLQKKKRCALTWMRPRIVHVLLRVRVTERAAQSRGDDTHAVAWLMRVSEHGLPSCVLLFSMQFTLDGQMRRLQATVLEQSRSGVSHEGPAPSLAGPLPTFPQEPHPVQNPPASVALPSPPT